MIAPVCHHVHFLCNDLEGMIEFWVKGFGAVFGEYRKFGAADGATLDIGMGAKLFLKVVPCERQDSGPDRSGAEHLGMLVPDLDAALARLTALPGVSAKPPFMSGPMRCAFVRGPEGVLVEVMQPPA